MGNPVFYICGVLVVYGGAPGSITHIVLTNAGADVYNPASPPMPEMARKYIDKYVSRAVHILPDVILISNHNIDTHG